MSLESDGGMMYGQRETEELVEKPVPVPHCPPQFPHGLTRGQTRASAVRGRRLTTWAMAQPFTLPHYHGRMFDLVIGKLTTTPWFYSSWRTLAASGKVNTNEINLKTHLLMAPRDESPFDPPSVRLCMRHFYYHCPSFQHISQIPSLYIFVLSTYFLLVFSKMTFLNTLYHQNSVRISYVSRLNYISMLP
jgi:hypothetical protein